MRPRFEPDADLDEKPAFSPNLIDPEAYDASEQKFSASLERPSPDPSPRFVVEEEPPLVTTEKEDEGTSPEVESGVRTSQAKQPAPSLADPEQPDPESWRREVAARLSHYRARRRVREPRYPSLQLKFESEPVWHAHIAESLPATPTVRQATENPNCPVPPRITLAELPPERPRILPAPTTDTSAKVIEFASYSPAPRPADELAEPVLDRPRIIEAPELTPPPPALGGILIEPVEQPASARRPGFEIPLQTAPLARRMAAAGIDAILVLTAFAAFTYIFFRINATLLPPAKAAVTAAVLVGLLWSAYQDLLLVFSGATPGLKLAKLELQCFDGSPVPRRIRNWRVLASVLSGLSLGLGYAWCLLDEDELCWHDRITRTYMAPKK
jgi:uncharacterized RDD family membrane protein YckC